MTRDDLQVESVRRDFLEFGIGEAEVQVVDRGGGEPLVSDHRRPSGIGDDGIDTDADGLSWRNGNACDAFARNGFGDDVLSAHAGLKLLAFECPTDRQAVSGGITRHNGNSGVGLRTAKQR